MIIFPYFNNTSKILIYIEKHNILLFSSNGIKKLRFPFILFNQNKNGNIILSGMRVNSHNFLLQNWSKYYYTWLLFIYCNFKIRISKFEIRGFAYKIKKEYNLILFKLGYSHLVYFPLSLDILISDNPLKKKRDNVTYFLYGHSQQTIGLNSYMLSELRKINIYSGYGIRNVSHKFFLKKGKVSAF